MRQRKTSILLFVWVCSNIFFLLVQARNRNHWINNWNTLYSYKDGKIYLHLKDNGLIALNFSIAGFQGNDHLQIHNLHNGENVESLESPPEGTDLALIENDLYGFHAKSEEGRSEKDNCGGGIITLIKYDTQSNSWKDVEVSHDDVDDASFYAHSVYMSDPASKQVYIYGGQCNKTGSVNNRLISFDLDKHSFFNLTTEIQPQPFYGASSVLAPNAQTQLLLGGRTSLAWLGMYQLATWKFEGGWTFNSVSKDNKVQVHSREFALSLPIFDPINNTTLPSFMENFSVKEVLLLGGESSKSTLSLPIAKLKTNSSVWSWETLEEKDIHYDEILGACTLFNTLAIINSTSESSNKKRGNPGYTINLLDTDSLQPVKNVKSNMKNFSKKKSNNSTVKKKAIMGTVIPVSVILLLVTAVCVFIYVRKRNQLKDKDSMVSQYQKEKSYDQSSLLSQLGAIENPFRGDSKSTLDADSMNSWVKKRQQYDESRAKFYRHSFHNSNETLSNSISSSEKISEKHDHFDDEMDLTMSDHIRDSPSYLAASRSLSRLKRSFPIPNVSHSQNKSDYVPVRSKSSKTALTRLSLKNSMRRIPELKLLPDSRNTSAALDSTFDSNSDVSFDEDIEAQVLVSSKRRSVLKVTNPDSSSASISEQTSSKERFATPPSEHITTELRIRVPSGDDQEHV